MKKDIIDIAREMNDEIVEHLTKLNILEEMKELQEVRDILLSLQEIAAPEDKEGFDDTLKDIEYKLAALDEAWLFDEVDE